MLERNVTVTLKKAKEWYNSNNATLKEIALQAFSEEELYTYSFQSIRTFEDALEALGYRESTKVYIRNSINDISMYSKASAAMTKLNIIRKALNRGYNLHLTKNADGQDCTWYPCLRFITKDSTYYNFELRNDTFEKIGKITSEGVTYDVLGGHADPGGAAGLGHFYSGAGVCFADANFGFLGCATEEIAEHFGKYFGMLIMEAMYGDMVDFEKSE